MRVVVKFDKNDEYCNLEGDYIVMADGLVSIYNNNLLIGVFKIKIIKAVWLSEKGCAKNAIQKL